MKTLRRTWIEREAATLVRLGLCWPTEALWRARALWNLKSMAEKHACTVELSAAMKGPWDFVGRTVFEKVDSPAGIK